MICVTGGEGTVADLARRIRTHPVAVAVSGASSLPVIHEARLDLLRKVTPEQVAALPEIHQLVVTCRRPEEGGGFVGDELSRLALLETALEAGARYVDLEAAAPDATWAALHRRFGGDRLLASAHRFEPGGASQSSLAALHARLVTRPAATLKLAVAVEDVAELGSLRQPIAGDRRPLLRIGMGLAGLPGRIRPEVMGSPWTYATAPGTTATAPGQIPFEALREILERGARRLLALLGGPGVSTSPGPAVYNALAAREGLGWHYLATPTRDLAGALDVLDSFGLFGASVTMPHKAAAAALARRLDDGAARLGAVNTLVPDGAGHWGGHNTDGAGVLGALAPHLQPGSRVAVLGTGGAAAAAVAGLVQGGYRVAVAGRREEASAHIARTLGGTPVGWSELPSVTFDALVNATPLGSDGETQALPEAVSLKGKVILDMVLLPAWTPLLRRAQREGGVALGGVEMWVHQGAPQLRLLTGLDVTPATLRSLLPAEHRAHDQPPEGGERIR